MERSTGKSDSISYADDHPFPTNNLTTPFLTDLYQITMAYAYWKAEKHEQHAVFDLFFRKNPFQGEFTVFAGLDEVLRFVATFHFSRKEIVYLSEKFPFFEPEFLSYLEHLDCSKVKLLAMKEGTICFPREPLIRVEGPLLITQLLETTLLVLVNFPSLVATNAARMRLAAGDDKTMVEFGLRRAQGPDGGVSASKYAYIGGFDGTSNLQAAMLTGIAIKGTHAHSFVMSYSSLDDLLHRTVDGVDFVEICLRAKTLLGYDRITTNQGELAAFISYAQCYPRQFLALIDTYDTISSGIRNFLIVATGLYLLGQETNKEYKALGIRLDSGDLSYLSIECRRICVSASQVTGISYLASISIWVSNDINEEVLYALNKQGHSIDGFGIGTHLVTCQSQPALGCVYKLVELNQVPRIKISEDINKVIIPGRKTVHRVHCRRSSTSSDLAPVVDIIQMEDEPIPAVGERIMCRHPVNESMRAYVTPEHVEPLLFLVWDGQAFAENSFQLVIDSLDIVRERVWRGLRQLRKDHIRNLNPTPYKVSVTPRLYDYLHELWMKEAPIKDL